VGVGAGARERGIVAARDRWGDGETERG